MSSSNFFAQVHRPVVVRAHPEFEHNGHAGNNAVNRLVGAAWRALSVEDRRPYELLAARDKLRYWKVR
jgi:HMG (high mobility group) box